MIRCMLVQEEKASDAEESQSPNVIRIYRWGAKGRDSNEGYKICSQIHMRDAKGF